MPKEKVTKTKTKTKAKGNEIEAEASAKIGNINIHIETDHEEKQNKKPKRRVKIVKEMVPIHDYPKPNYASSQLSGHNSNSNTHFADTAQINPGNGGLEPISIVNNIEGAQAISNTGTMKDVNMDQKQDTTNTEQQVQPQTGEGEGTSVGEIIGDVAGVAGSVFAASQVAEWLNPGIGERTSTRINNATRSGANRMRSGVGRAGRGAGRVLGGLVQAAGNLFGGNAASTGSRPSTAPPVLRLTNGPIRPTPVRNAGIAADQRRNVPMGTVVPNPPNPPNIPIGNLAVPVMPTRSMPTVNTTTPVRNAGNAAVRRQNRPDVEMQVMRPRTTQPLGLNTPRGGLPVRNTEVQTSNLSPAQQLRNRLGSTTPVIPVATNQNRTRPLKTTTSRLSSVNEIRQNLFGTTPQRQGLRKRLIDDNTGREMNALRTPQEKLIDEKSLQIKHKGTSHRDFINSDITRAQTAARNRAPIEISNNGPITQITRSRKNRAQTMTPNTRAFAELTPLTPAARAQTAPLQPRSNLRAMVNETRSTGVIPLRQTPTTLRPTNMQEMVERTTATSALQAAMRRRTQTRAAVPVEATRIERTRALNGGTEHAAYERGRNHRMNHRELNALEFLQQPLEYRRGFTATKEKPGPKTGAAANTRSKDKDKDKKDK